MLPNVLRPNATDHVPVLADEVREALAVEPGQTVVDATFGAGGHAALLAADLGGRGKLIADCTTEDFIERSSDKSVLVKSPDAAKLRELITAAGGQVTADDEGNLDVRQLEAPRIGELAARDGLVLYELSPQLASLEEAFMELTRDSLDYGGHGPDGSDPAVVAAACAEGSAL